jgi:alpha-glucuronidase
MKKLFFILSLFLVSMLYAEEGYRLWLRYDKIDDAALLQQYRNEILSIKFTDSSPTLLAAKEELSKGLSGSLDKKISEQSAIKNGCVLVGTASASDIRSLISNDVFKNLGTEGFDVLGYHPLWKIVLINANYENYGRALRQLS